MNETIITKYFSDFTPDQLRQFAALGDLYRDWNSKINVISRKDIDNIYLHHVLHSLAIAIFIQFKEGTKVIDLGTGGGFPGIPLAIMFPDVQFHLVDGTRKKIKVVQEVAEAINLKNLKAEHVRAEYVKARQYDFVVCRAVAQLSQLWTWSERLLRDRQTNVVPNGLIALKGGNVDKEIKALPKGSYTDKEEITNFFEEEYFEEKYIVYVQY